MVLTTHQQLAHARAHLVLGEPRRASLVLAELRSWDFPMDLRSRATALRDRAAQILAEGEILTATTLMPEVEELLANTQEVSL